MPIQLKTQLVDSVQGSIKLLGGTERDLEWKDQLKREGWCVVKGVLSTGKAKQYEDGAYEFLESFDLGFDRHDRSTWVAERMPYFYKGGLIYAYGSGHEQFVWDVKQDPAVVNVFAEIWGTDELVVSYDGFNFSLPLPDRPEEDFKAWAHVDQSPLVTGFHCLQGIVNILPNGPEDGGLMVLKGSSALYKELWRAFDEHIGGWNKHDRHDHTPEQIQWLLDHGCEWHKVCADPGDLLLWDSRTVHYGATPTSTNPRLASYVCYKPARMVTPELKAKRRLAWDEKKETTHDPITFTANRREPPEDHPTFGHLKVKQLQEPRLTALGRKLAGLDDW
ncbi:hypothetical protein BD324DRAFT_679068 [Kockovaella imperatae]|uniref:Phytanoyl-CoA dioxygenase n=1 Tax=Kockovaella imperatae TaxID=4999 RepID=A0A1Y1UPP4_9TREE|nr:hypothetical protein BD324DRAFT_679068 [Kockovaella imperatae]ORX40001.1 hypothetical protein BD324DRAFT_679068 [Kockovaella imperatae]